MTHKNLLESFGWRGESPHKSLEEVHKSIPVPKSMSFWRKLLAFSGPGYMVAVGYMDPGNWATDLAGGSKFGYTLLFVILLSNLFAILLQHLSAKLGIVSGRDLAQSCRDTFPKWMNFVLWIMAEIMITACDLAEVIGSAIALNLLFGLPLVVGVVITALDVLVLLMLQQKGFRYLEALVITLVGTVVVCFGLEIIFSKPELFPMLKGFIPVKELFTNKEIMYIAVGILGATVMPHNLYLHSAIVQTRNYSETEEGKREAVKFSTIDSTVALIIAFFVNAAILVVAAATFYTRGIGDVAEIDQAYNLLTPLLGAGFASTIFAVALLASGQNSTITATLAGQIVMEGFLNLRIKPWLRRMITRVLAIIPAIFVVTLYGGSGLAKLLILSQVVLSIQLPFAVFPLIMFTSDKKKMGMFANGWFIKLLAMLVGLFIAALNVWLIYNILFTA
ncbi:MAG: Nramp family divalent metal transporter [Patescibacteria group bacterium]